MHLINCPGTYIVLLAGTFLTAQPMQIMLSSGGIKATSAYVFCTNTQTLRHVVGGYIVAVNEKYYNWRQLPIVYQG